MALPTTDHRPLTDSRLANLAAQSCYKSFDQYHDQFKAITSQAKTRFEQCDWTGMQSDATERLDLYRKIVDQTVPTIIDLLQDRVNEKLVWASIKAVYSGLIAGRDDWELAETFFNSITRRIFTTVGVNHQIEFVDTDFDTPPTKVRPVCGRYTRAPSTAVLIEQILDSYDFHCAFKNKAHDARKASRVIEGYLRKIGALRVIEQVEMVESIFFRGKAAYLIGRIFSGAHTIPLVLCLLNSEQGIVLDAVLLTENEVSILFSFARNYFHVDVERPYDLVLFLSQLMPRKRLAELYISTGFNKHGKTELYRDILGHLSASTSQFEIARGEKGMVMTVFTMPDYDLVFKLIKDKFAYPKRSTRREVMEKYKLVFKHDRAGRLVDAQEFEHLQFCRERFSDELLAELQKVVANTITVTEDTVVIQHAYVERRVIPLNLYIYEADEAAAKTAVIEYGNAIKDMAATNIFAGDLWLKNFGVTRHGRVVFYDYDELGLLTDYNFRKIPQSRHYDDELSDTPWFTVNDNDVFPEEFESFLGFKGQLLEAFLAHHADLLDVSFWHDYQQRHRNGESIHFYPYSQKRRLHDK